MKLLLALLIIIIVLFSSLTAYMFIENTELKRELQGLKSKYGELKSKYDELTGKYNKLYMDYEDLSSKYSELHEEYSALKADYEKLSTMYQGLRKEHELYVIAYENVRKTILSRTNLNPESWPEKIDYLSPEVSKAVHEAAKSWFGTIYSKIWNWIRENIRYVEDVELPIPPETPGEPVGFVHDYWRKASETLKAGAGDCEDQAILAAAMILNYWQTTFGKTYAIWCVFIEGPGGAHVFTIIPVKGGKAVIVDPVGPVEPVEKNIEEAILEYMEAWKQQGQHYNKVYAVFNHKEYKILNMNIYEFIKWLYEQTT